MRLILLDLIDEQNICHINIAQPFVRCEQAEILLDNIRGAEDKSNIFTHRNSSSNLN
jgi:hypothetical protein